MILISIFVIYLRYRKYGGEIFSKSEIAKGTVSKSGNLQRLYKEDEVIPEDVLKAEAEQRDKMEAGNSTEEIQNQVRMLEEEKEPKGPVVYEPTINAAILLRIYENDPHSWSRKDLADWIFWHLYAGVHHIYIYDHYNGFNRNVESLKTFIDFLNVTSYVTYHDWSARNYEGPQAVKKDSSKSYEIHSDQQDSLKPTRMRAYNHALDETRKDRFKSKFFADWQINLNLHEYVFSATDQRENFLVRIVQEQIRKEISASSEDSKIIKEADISGIKMSVDLYDDKVKPIADGDNEFYVAHIAERNIRPISGLEFSNCLHHTEFIKDIPEEEDEDKIDTSLDLEIKKAWKTKKPSHILEVDGEVLSLNRYRISFDGEGPVQGKRFPKSVKIYSLTKRVNDFRERFYS